MWNEGKRLKGTMLDVDVLLPAILCSGSDNVTAGESCFTVETSLPDSGVILSLAQSIAYLHKSSAGYSFFHKAGCMLRGILWQV